MDFLEEVISMANEKKPLHPRVAEFKEFVKRHPKLVREVRSNNRTWQDIFDEWQVLGEEDDTWKTYKKQNSTNQSSEKNADEKEEGSKKNDFMKQLFGIIENVDMNEVQKHIGNASGAIANIQSLIGQFQANNQGSDSIQPTQTHQDPFSFKKD